MELLRVAIIIPLLEDRFNKNKKDFYMKWEDLNTQNRAELIKLYVRNGVTSLDKMKEHYNSFGGGGRLVKKKPEYKEWVKGVDKRFLSDDYNLETAYNELGYDRMEAWRRNPSANHLPDTYKLPNHITFSEESIDPIANMRGGRWIGDKFYPSEVNRMFHPNVYKHKGVPYVEVPYSDRGMLPVEMPKFNGGIKFGEGGHLFAGGGDKDKKKPSTSDILKYELSKRLMNEIQYRFEGETEHEKWESNGLPQDTFLMDRDSQDNIFKWLGWRDVTDKGYGLVDRAVKNSGHNNVPVYQKENDMIDESRLVMIPGFSYNDMGAGMWNNVDAGNFPIQYAIGDDGKVYWKGWDYNDYKGIGKKYHTPKWMAIAGDLMDFVGSPVVTTSGWNERDNVDSYLEPKYWRDVNKDFENLEDELNGVYPKDVPENVQKWLDDRGQHLEWVPGHGYIVVNKGVTVKGKKK